MTEPPDRPTPTPASPRGRGWQVVIPVKDASVGKSRLAASLARHGWDADVDRIAVSRGIADDTIAAVRACPLVERVVLVTSDSLLGRRWSGAGAVVVADPGTGLNHAISLGLARTGAGAPVAALLGDLPALTPHDLAEALSAAGAVAQGVVPDQDGSGSVLRTSAPGAVRFTPRFGPDSAALHVRDGATRLDLALPRLRTDVDDLATLRAAAALGLGTSTRAALAGLDLLGWDACRQPSTTSTPSP